MKKMLQPDTEQGFACFGKMRTSASRKTELTILPRWQTTHWWTLL